MINAINTAKNQWAVTYEDDATKTLEKLAKRDKPTVELIRNAMLAVAETGNPRSRGKGLTGDRAGQWRYRVGDWRVTAEIQDANLIIKALEVGHRSKIYKRKK